MAERIIYTSTDLLNHPYEKEIISFKWVNGLSKQKKQENYKEYSECIKNHLTYIGEDPNTWLEISTYSDKELGKNLSAKNLKFTKGFFGQKEIVENVYQSSKVIINNKIVDFKYMNHSFPTEPKSLFYDYIYCLALLQNGIYHEELKYYNFFTDLAFNHTAGKINTQARAAAIFKTLLINKKINIINNYQEFEKYYLENVKIK